MPAHVLLVEDEERLAAVVRDYLEQQGFAVTWAADGPAALAAVAAGPVDIVLLDLMLPGMDGLAVCRELRHRHDTLPIIMVTARADDVDRIVGLELGADDYVTKPFNLRELVARVRAVLRRAGGHANGRPQVLSLAGLEIDLEGGEVRRGGQPVPLTATEFKILAALAARPGRVFSRTQLLDVAMGTYYAGYERSVDTHIFNLRRKLEPDPARPRLLVTVHGLGYKFVGGGQEG